MFQEITQGAEIIKVGKREIPARAYVSSFNFRGTDQQKLVGALSGGERNRVHLAKLLQSGGNVLLLDEPTNDLDVDTLRALEAGLESFPGCVVVISHDRWFLDRIATHILAFEGDSQVRWFEGNVSDYEAFRHKELGTAADQPHRIRYKRLAAERARRAARREDDLSLAAVEPHPAGLAWRDHGRQARRVRPVRAGGPPPDRAPGPLAEHRSPSGSCPWVSATASSASPAAPGSRCPGPRRGGGSAPAACPCRIAIGRRPPRRADAGGGSRSTSTASRGAGAWTAQR